MKRRIVINWITYFFILLYLYTGGSKLMDLHLFRQQMMASPLLGSVAGLVAWGLPVLEFIVAALLFIPATRLKGLYASLALMSLFTIYLIAILIADNHLSCSCGGIVEDLSPRQHLIFNIACIALLWIGITVYKKADSPPRFRSVSLAGTAFLFLLIVGLFHSALADKGTVKTGMEGRLLPAFDLVLPDSLSRLNTRDIPTGRSFIMMGFSPYCSHCQEATREIIQNMDKFNSTRIYMVTTLPLADLRQFDSVFNLAKYPNIILAKDPKTYFLSYFRSTGIPYLAIFDTKKRLKEVMTGRVKIDQVTHSLIQ